MMVANVTVELHPIEKQYWTRNNSSNYFNDLGGLQIGFSEICVPKVTVPIDCGLSAAFKIATGWWAAWRAAGDDTRAAPTERSTRAGRSTTCGKGDERKRESFFPGRAQETETRTRRANQYLVPLSQALAKVCVRLHRSAMLRLGHTYFLGAARGPRLLLQILTQAPIDTAARKTCR